MGRVAADAAFAQGVVFENKRSFLGEMTLEAGLVLAEQRDAATFYLLRKSGAAPFDGRALVRIMAIGATDLAFQNRMVMRQLELGPHFQVTLETGLRRFLRINDRVRPAAALHVQATRAMARFAAHVLRVVALRFQARVRRRAEIARDRFVAGRALLRADKLRARDARRCQDRVGGTAGKQDQCHGRPAARKPKPACAIANKSPR